MKSDNVYDFAKNMVKSYIKIKNRLENLYIMKYNHL